MIRNDTTTWPYNFRDALQRLIADYTQTKGVRNLFSSQWGGVFGDQLGTLPKNAFGLEWQFEACGEECWTRRRYAPEGVRDELPIGARADLSVIVHAGPCSPKLMSQASKVLVGALHKRRTEIDQIPYWSKVCLVRWIRDDTETPWERFSGWDKTSDRCRQLKVVVSAKTKEHRHNKQLMWAVEAEMLKELEDDYWLEDDFGLEGPS